MQSTIESAQERSITHTLLEPEELQTRYPQFLYHGHEQGYFEQEGGVLFPERCMLSQLERAEENGAKIVRNCSVNIGKQGDAVAITTTKGPMGASLSTPKAASFVCGFPPGFLLV